MSSPHRVLNDSSSRLALAMPTPRVPSRSSRRSARKYGSAMKLIVGGLLVLAALLVLLAFWMPWDQSGSVPPIETPNPESRILSPAPGTA